MNNPSDISGALDTNNLKSEIINRKKQFIFEVISSDEYVYPNQEYQYQIYCKNNNLGVDNGRIIENVHIQIINPEEVAINEDTYPPEGIEIGSLSPQEAQLIYLPSRCSATGEFTVHFLCFGDQTGLFVQSVKIICDYNTHNGQSVHRLHIYNFQPYEDTYMLRSNDYSDTVTQLTKVQKLPYKAKQGLFKMEYGTDESQSYLNQNEILYGDMDENENHIPIGQRVNSDEHSYQYIERENFNQNISESYTGESLSDLFNQVNEKSKFIKATFLQNGNNELKTAFQQYYPDGFMYRFGLLSSEIYHHVGVLPSFSYMNDRVFRWAPNDTFPASLYPEIKPMQWNTKKWAGRGWHIYKTYTDEYKNEIINDIDYKPLMEFLYTVSDLKDAERFIELQTSYDKFDVHYITVDDETYKIPKYKYILKEIFFDSGVFFVNIPLDKIPSNFFILENAEIQNIVERTKPLGMKPLIRYIKHLKFNNSIGFDFTTKLYTKNSFDIGEYHRFNYYIQSMQYHNIIETICHEDANENKIYEERETLKLIPSGYGFYNGFSFRQPVSMNIHPPQPKYHKPIDSSIEINTQRFDCGIDNNLSYLSQLHNLLYQGNFEAISFFVKNLPLSRMPKPDIAPITSIVPKIDYKLWIDSLKIPAGATTNPHSYIWNLNVSNNAYYAQTGNTRQNKIDFMAINLTSLQFTSPNVETGIGVQDITGKYHGISAEYNPNIEAFNIKYATSFNNNFTVRKHIIANDMIGLAYKLIYTPSNTLVIFFTKQMKDDDIVYNYFHHVITPTLKNVFCFTRNEIDIKIGYWSDIIDYHADTDAKVYFNTPQYNDLKIYDPDVIDNTNTTWKNLYRIDRNEYSYAYVTNKTNEMQEVSDIQLHYDALDIPEDAIIKNIILRATLETNAAKGIYYNHRIQDNFIMDSGNNNLILYPQNLECYKATNYNTDYYLQQYEIAQTNNAKRDINIYQSKIIENELFNEMMDISIDDYLLESDDYITVSTPMWVELSEFGYQDYSFNDINDVVFVIEGYNSGKEVYITAQLTQESTYAPVSQIKIPCGYFRKHIHLEQYNKFNIANVGIRFKFNDLNSDMRIFDTYMEIEFKDKQSQFISFSEYNTTKNVGKNIVYLNILEEEIPAYLLQNGLTVNLMFDDLYPGEYCRIYAVELDVIYQKQSIDFLINSDTYKYLETSEKLFIVSGNDDANYLCGMFFDDLPSISQLESTTNQHNIGVELDDAIYQSFVAQDDNISSITLFPNGFMGNPDSNMKIALYTNQGHVPDKLIKEIHINGWSKSNPVLNGANDITYNFNVNNLEIGETYWIKISVDEKRENSYYLLKYIDKPQPNMKLLIDKNDNFINMLGALKFQLNRINLYNSFNHIPISHTSSINPNIFISINKGDGVIQGLKVRKQVGVNNG